MATSSGVPPRIRALQRHLRGVRARLGWVLLSSGVGASLTWYFRDTIFVWLYAPARRHLSDDWQPIFTGPTEMLGLAIQLAMWGGLVVAFPVFMYHVLRFFWPVLGRSQRRFLAFCLPVVLLCYLAGAAFAYFVMLPTSMGFLLKFGTGIAIPLIRITEYMDLVMMLIFWLGVVFELPLIMVALTKLRVVRFRRFWQWNKYVPVFASILSAVITPTLDVVNMAFVAIPIVGLYQIGLICAFLVKGRDGARPGSRPLSQRH